jgi:predicted short-subunit dehydrogenase-like oxidoreductase (DUF2520 family)
MQTTAGAPLPPGWCDVVGRGRMGAALAAAMREAGMAVRGPLGRGATGEGAALVILCVPDREIGAAAAAIRPGPMVGHVSASADIALLSPHERFVLHPLLSVVGAGARFAGATAAIDGGSPAAMNAAAALARALGMRPQAIPVEQRALYHAAASAASNYLVAVESMAESLAARVGLDRAALAPLVRATVENWAELGARGALTGPIVRGDVLTAVRQRTAVSATAPEHLALWDALATATRDLAAQPLEAGG